MPLFKSGEDKTVKAEAKQAEAQAREEAERAEKLAREAAREAERFAQTPVGKARQAYSDGDAFFEIGVPHSQIKGVVAAMVGVASTVKHAKGGTDTLGAIAAEGWKLVNPGWVYVQTGQESRDKFLASGQQIVTTGHVVGIYLFERAPQEQVPATNNPI